MLLTMEQGMVKSLDPEKLVDDFVYEKSRRKPLLLM